MYRNAWTNLNGEVQKDSCDITMVTLVVSLPEIDDGYKPLAVLVHCLLNFYMFRFILKSLESVIVSGLSEEQGNDTAA